MTSGHLGGLVKKPGAIRSRSASPASSVDSTTRRRRKKGVGRAREDVQVFTSLPPKVDGEIKSYLVLQMTRINWSQDIQLTTTAPRTTTSIINRSSKPKPSDVQELQTAFLNSLTARCLWWGEESASGSIFRPRVTFNGTLESSRKCQTTARYVVRSGLKQLASYLNDMKTLEIEVVNEKTMDSLGKAYVHELGQLSPSSAIKGYFPVFNSHQIKIAEIWVSMRLESPRGKLQMTIGLNLDGWSSHFSLLFL